MISWIKKQKYKIAIALCSILSIFTLFLVINKTYAYDTDRFSYTISNIYDNSISDNMSLVTYNNVSGVKLSYNSNSQNYQLNHSNNFTTEGQSRNFYILINFYFINNNTNEFTNDNNIIGNFSNALNLSLYYMSNAQTLSNQTINNSYMYRKYNDNKMYTIVKEIYYTTSSNNNNIWLYVNNFDTRNNYSLFISNIDIVTPNNIGLQEYYDTYYSQIEDNYNILLDNYNDLQEDYITLEGNYNTLQDNYDSLEQDYNNALTTINNASTIRQYLDFTNINVYISYNNNLNNLELTFNQLIDNNILVNSSFYINRVQSYLITNNYITSEQPYFTLRINFDNSIVHLNWSNLQWYVKNDNLNTSAFTFEMDDTANNETYTAYVAVDSGNYVYDANTFLNHQIGSNFTYIYDDIISIEEYYNNLMSNDFVITCQSQYADGYNVGYTDGLNTASRNYQNDIKDLNDDIRALQEANASQYQLGYRNGYEVGSNQDFSQSGFTTLLNEIMSYPVNMLRSVFNFEFMGINLFGVLTFFVSLGIVLFVIHRFKK